MGHIFSLWSLLKCSSVAVNCKRASLFSKMLYLSTQNGSLIIRLFIFAMLLAGCIPPSTGIKIVTPPWHSILQVPWHTIPGFPSNHGVVRSWYVLPSCDTKCNQLSRLLLAPSGAYAVLLALTKSAVWLTKENVSVEFSKKPNNYICCFYICFYF